MRFAEKINAFLKFVGSTTRRVLIKRARRIARNQVLVFVFKYFSALLAKLNPKITGTLHEPWDYIQIQIEERLHHYLNCETGRIRWVMIVGGYYAYEVDRMLETYPNAQFIIFEASPRYFSTLESRFRGKSRVTCEHYAVTEACGHVTFHETNLEGSGSVLLPSPTGERIYGLETLECYNVRGITLDSYTSKRQLDEMDIDLLWCDVQGAELKVLLGAPRLLEKCKAIFLEISTFETPYTGACTLTELQELLGPLGFALVGLGTSPRNGTGNAFWIRPESRRSRAERCR